MHSGIKIEWQNPFLKDMLSYLFLFDLLLSHGLTILIQRFKQVETHIRKKSLFNLLFSFSFIFSAFVSKSLLN